MLITKRRRSPAACCCCLLGFARTLLRVSLRLRSACCCQAGASACCCCQAGGSACCCSPPALPGWQLCLLLLAASSARLTALPAAPCQAGVTHCGRKSHLSDSGVHMPVGYGSTPAGATHTQHRDRSTNRQTNTDVRGRHLCCCCWHWPPLYGGAMEVCRQVAAVLLEFGDTQVAEATNTCRHMTG